MSKARTLDPSVSTSRTAIPATRRFEPIAVRIDDAAEIIGVSRDKMWKMVRDKRLHSFKIDGCAVIHYAELVSFVRSAAGLVAEPMPEPAKEAQ